MDPSKSWLEVSRQRLLENYRALTQLATSDGRNTPVLAVVKADAYGHGAALCAPLLAAAGASWLGVAHAQEGVTVRRSLCAAKRSELTEPRILVMCGLVPAEVETIVESRLTPVVWSTAHLELLAAVATPASPLPVHLEIDTGMSRQGVKPDEALNQLLDDLSRRPELHLEGVMTHFASAELSGSRLFALQQQRFEGALSRVFSRGFHPEWIHAANSAAIDEASSLSWLETLVLQYGTRSLARSGIALYGYTLPLQGATSSLHGKLKPVLTWKARVLSIEELPPGSAIGYNGTFTAVSPMRVALLPVGYSDGLRRELSGTDQRAGGWVLLHGQRAPIVGRISMNLTTIDVTSIPQAEVGDEVIVLGDGITADDHARLADTISYEILCGLRSPPSLTP